MPPRTKAEIISEINRPQWSVEAMSVAVAAKRSSREAKGRVFNCFVLNEDKQELTTFLKLLQSRMNDLPNPCRLQLAVKAEMSSHFTGIDMLIEKDKSGTPQVKVFCIDAASAASGLDNLNTVKKIFPDSMRMFYKEDRFM